MFIGLDRSASEWAHSVKDKIEKVNRTDHSDSVKNAGFDSSVEAEKLLKYYEKL